MPHFGSVFVTSVNPFSASSYQNECRSATARLNCCCARRLHDTEKLTRPSFSPISCLCRCVSCAFTENGKRSTPRDAPRNNLLSFITIPICKSVDEWSGRHLVFENDLAANHRHHATGLQDFHLRNLHDIGREHRQIGKLAYLD